MKKLVLLVTSLLLPMNVLAYSNKVILGGENIGIHIDSKRVIVIGFYQVNGKSVKGNPEIMIGDEIIKVNGTMINNINELTDTILKEIKDNKITLTVVRNGKELDIEMNLEQVDGVYKTGLYVKDSITGIGTLTYIDPETKIYGALGHEILESKSLKLVEVKTGNVFESTITSIKKSTKGDAGEKNANFSFNNIYGNILQNTNKGIFGFWDNLKETNYIQVGTKEDIQVGDAIIYTVLSGSEKKGYHINITSIQDYNDTKNISFEITDKELILKSGGIVQGMSGSPIVQYGKIVGAVTHVIVDNPLTGYGIFVTTMLETGDKLNN